MAVDWSRINFFNRLDARMRLLVLVAITIAVIVFGYLAVTYLFNSAASNGTSVATAPNLRSVPGQTLTPEYQRALMQANKQTAAQAQMSGKSAVPTLINFGVSQNTGGCVICVDQTANIKVLLDDWVQKGDVSPDVAQLLEQLADNHAPVNAFGYQLDNLIAKNGLTPTQARKLLDVYHKQYINVFVATSAKWMDGWIKSGKLPLEAANRLLDLQRKWVSFGEYAKALKEMVVEHEITDSLSQQLLSQYIQAKTQVVTDGSVAYLEQLVSMGKLPKEVGLGLIDLERKMVSQAEFTAALQKYISQGLLIPVIANDILDEFKKQKEELGFSSTFEQLIKKAQDAAYLELQQLLEANTITKAVYDQIMAMVQNDISMAEFQQAITQLVQQKKLSPEIAALKLKDFSRIKNTEAVLNRLAQLQNNNASPQEYAAELKRAVQAGILTPAEASQLMKEYQAKLAAPGSAAEANPPGADNSYSSPFAQLQQRVQAGELTPSTETNNEFAAAAQEATETATQEAQVDISSLVSAMDGQAQQLIASWQPVAMAYRVGSERPAKNTSGTGAEKGATAGAKGTTQENLSSSGTKPLIKAGTIYFAILDTTVNSDYPGSPVMATIVQGPFKGGKLLGKLQMTSTPAGQMDRVLLNFNLMNLDSWDDSKTVTAYAIDPDTAKTALATSVDKHYLLRFGAMIGTSFLQGYANAIQVSGSNVTTGIFGTSTTYPALSPGNKLAVGLGQVGQTLGNVVQNYANIPPTVKVASGVGIGILFMSDVR